MVDEPQKETDSNRKLHVDLAVLQVTVANMDKKLDALATDMRNVYATKAALQDVVEDVKALRDNIGWAIKLILGLVIVALVGLVMVKGGVPRP